MALSYGSITIVDITDIGEFSVYPQCNLPTVVIYDPNNNTYTPNWGEHSGNTYPNELLIEPVVYYAGEQVSLANLRQVTWKKQIGTNDAGTITSGTDGQEIIENGKLRVRQTQFSDNINMISYICVVDYYESEADKVLTAEGRITFTLVRHANKLKKCTINGENVFKYAAGQTSPVGTGTIVLTARLDNVTNGNWQYLNSSDTYVNFPTTYNSDGIDGLSINVNANDAIFVGDIATIKKLTSDPSVYDIVTVVKLRDGAPLRAISLSNEDQMIPCESDGTPKTGAFEHATTTVTVYDGSGIASGWTYAIKQNGEVGVSGTFNTVNRTYQVNSWTGAGDTASVTFQATKSGESPLEAKFTLTKIKTGADGTSPKYQELVCSALTANRTAGTTNITWTPATIDFSAKERDGATTSDYTGYIEIYKNNGSTAVVSEAMTGTPPKYTYTIPTESTLTSLRVVLRKTGGGGDALDSQTIVLTKNGETGAQGDGASNIVLGNYNDVIPCDTNGTVSANTTIEIPFTGFKGTNRVAATITTAKISGLIANQISCTSITNATTSASGKVVLQFAAGSTLGDSEKGTITLTFTVGGVEIPMTYSWAKSIQAANGLNAVVFQCYAPGGDIIENDSNNVVLSSWLIDGSTTVTTGITYQWYQYSSTSVASDKYDAISGATSKELTVTPSMVTGYASFKCVAGYNSKSYSGYVAVRDKSDPIQVELFSSVGTQLLNSVGYGAVYARLFRNGQEIDNIKSTIFATTGEAPAASAYNYYYNINTAQKTCTLMKSNGSTWSTAGSADTPQYTYTWTFRDKNGNTTTYNSQSSIVGKAIYVDGSLIDKKIIFDCEVSEASS